MSSPESHAWQTYLKPRLRKWAAACDRIETVGSGVADVSYSLAGACGWIELKVAKGQLVYFRKYQIPWLVARVAQAPLVFLMVFQGEYVWLIHASRLLEVERRPQGRYTVVRLTDLFPLFTGRTDDPDCWKKVRSALVGEVTTY